MLSILEKALARPDRVFRLVGFSACVITGVNTVLTHQYVGPSPDMPGLFDVLGHHFDFVTARPSVFALDVVCYALFGWAFWQALDTRRLLRAGSDGVRLLVLQSVIGLLVSPALFFLIAAEAGFILQPRRASVWVVSLTLLGILLLLAMPQDAPPSFAAGALARESAPPRSIVLIAQCSMYPVIVLFSYCLGLIGGTEWRHRRELARVNAELKATRQMQAESARLAERLHISRELHDAVGHHLAALSVSLQLASRLAEGEAATPVREAHLIARTLLADVREVVSALRDEGAVDLPAAIETLAAGVRDPAIHVEVADSLKDVDPLQAHTLFRCAQEIITNAIKHADARNLWLKLTRDAEGVSLRARDDGRGADGVNPGNGLRGMRERVEEYGGRLRVEAKPGGGFAAEVFLPHAGGAR
jgi:signal transduction histidine kinase